MALTIQDVKDAVEACSMDTHHQIRTVDEHLAQIIWKKINEKFTSKKEAAMFLAHLILESVGFSKTEEDLERRRGRPYDDWYGRGFIQLTWKDNYEAAAKYLHDDSSYYHNPANRALIVSDLNEAMDVSVWFWVTQVRPRAAPFDNFGLTTLVINGAVERDHLNATSQTRFRYYNQIAARLGITDTVTNVYQC